MRKLTRSLTLAVMLATCGAIAHADIPTGTDPVPPTRKPSTSTTTSTTVATVLEVLSGIVL